MNPDIAVEKLRRDRILEGFDCGKEPLNRFLIRNALQNQQANASQTYVVVATDRVIGSCAGRPRAPSPIQAGDARRG